MKIRIGLCLTAISILLVTVVLVTAPIGLLFGGVLKDSGIRYSDFERATLASGELWLVAEPLPGLMRANYHWCPGLSLTRWCTDFSHPALTVKSHLTFSRSGEVRFTDTEIKQLDASVFGIAAGLLHARVTGYISNARLLSLNCPLAQLSDVSAEFNFAGLALFGANIGSHNLKITSIENEVGFRGLISGESINGKFALNEGSYSANGELLANEQVESLAKSLMTSLGENRYGWQLQGAIPCTVGAG